MEKPDFNSLEEAFDFIAAAKAAGRIATLASEPTPDLAPEQPTTSEPPAAPAALETQQSEQVRTAERPGYSRRIRPRLLLRRRPGLRRPRPAGLRLRPAWRPNQRQAASFLLQLRQPARDQRLPAHALGPPQTSTPSRRTPMRKSISSRRFTSSEPRLPASS